VNQWESLVKDVLGQCANVKTIAGSDVDPHDYELKPSDIADLDNADLVVVNGAGYDEWAVKALEGNQHAAVLNVAELLSQNQYMNTQDPTKLEIDNPHLWYSVEAINILVSNLAGEASKLQGAVKAVTQRMVETSQKVSGVQNALASESASLRDKKYAATESVADYLASTLGLVDLTPAEYKNASANESEPSIASIDAFEKLLTANEVDFLILNTQEASSQTDRLVKAAESAGVKVVDVTETLPEGQDDLLNYIKSTAEKFVG
jgi:zinc/manganese transport system substrate-binding protein